MSDLSMEIMTTGLDTETDALVRDWFAGSVQPLAHDGTRSVHLSAPFRPLGAIRIKGSGRGSAGVRWDLRHKTGPRAPIFDFEGRFTEDVASGHDNTFSGGASFQQAVTEIRVAQYLSAQGIQVTPGLGWGRISVKGAESWFSVYDWLPGWRDARPPAALTIETWRETLRGYPAAVLRLARDFGLIGYHWYVVDRDGALVWKDLHPFRGADRWAMSASSWVLQVYFGLHIRCNQIEFSAIPRWDLGLPREAILWPLEGLCPGVTLADHADLRARIVAPYMVGAPAGFDAAELARRIAENPVTAALLAQCPREFTRHPG